MGCTLFVSQTSIVCKRSSVVFEAWLSSCSWDICHINETAFHVGMQRIPNAHSCVERTSKTEFCKYWKMCRKTMLHA